MHYKTGKGMYFFNIIPSLSLVCCVNFSKNDCMCKYAETAVNDKCSLCWPFLFNLKTNNYK